MYTLHSIAKSKSAHKPLFRISGLKYVAVTHAMKEITLRAHRISRMSHCRAVYIVFGADNDGVNSKSLESSAGC